MPGIERFDQTNLIDVDQRQLEHVQAQIHRENVLFVLGEDTFAPGQRVEMEKMVRLITQLNQIVSHLGHRYIIEVFGHTDPSGAEAINQTLRQKRAQRVVAYLVTRGVSETHLSVGTGNLGLAIAGSSTDVNPELKRRVTFRVVVQEGEVGAL